MKNDFSSAALAAIALVCAAALPAAAEPPASEARSPNLHAMVKVYSSATNTIVAVPWMFYTPDGSASTNLPIDRLVRPTNLRTGDMVMALTNNGVYATWQLVENTRGEKVDGYTCREWREVATVQRANDGDSRSDVFASAHQDMAMQRGYGLWLYRQSPLATDGTPKPFYLYGQWTPGATNVTIRGGSEEAPAFTMLACPHPGRRVNLNDLFKDKWDEIGDTDTIIIPTDRSQVVYCFREKSRDRANRTKWNYARQWSTASMTTASGGSAQTSAYVTDIEFDPHLGFWYVRRTGEDMQFTWSEE